MGWGKPYWLLAMVIVIPILRFGGIRLRKKYRTTEGKPAAVLVFVSWLRAAAVGLIVLALADTSLLLPSKQRQVILAIDVSESIGSARIEQARKAALTIINQLNGNERVGIIAFAGNPRVITPLVAPGEAKAVLETDELRVEPSDQTNLQAALRLGKELLRQQPGNSQLVLFSDGRATTGGLTGSQINDLGVTVQVVPNGWQAGAVVTQGLELPDLAYTGQPVPLVWKVSANYSEVLRAIVKLDGQKVSEQVIQLEPGPNEVVLTLPEAATGVHQLELSAVTLAGQPLSQVTADGLLRVSGQAQTLVINGNSDRIPSPISQALRAQGLAVTERSAGQLPDSSTLLAGYLAVIFDNVAATRLTIAQQQAVQQYVSGGGGWLVVGGEQSLGRGDYFATALEEMLPVETDTRQRLFFTKAQILFVIDYSRSMAENIGNTSKQLAAMQCIAATARQLNPLDEVGILGFDTEPFWVLRFTPAGRRALIDESLAKLGGGGGTEMTAALTEITRSFGTPGPVRRHVIILTDGFTKEGDFQRLVAQLRTAGVSCSTIAVGEQVNETLLKNIAEWGQGQYYRTQFDQLPLVVAKETNRVLRDLIQEGRFQSKVGATAAITAGLEQGTPPVLGYLLTKPKKLAAIHLAIGPKNDPLLATWRYGAGKVAVFTSDSGQRWLAPWAGGSQYNRLWSQVTRFLERAVPTTGMHVRTQVTADSVALTIEGIDADGRLLTGRQYQGRYDNGSGAPFHFKETAPGHYEAVVPLQTTGLSSFTIHDQENGAWTVASVWNPLGAELRSLGPDLNGLTELSNGAGGRILSLTQPRLPTAGWSWTPVAIGNLLVITALLVLVIEIAIRSASLGQLAKVRESLQAWWVKQQRLIALIRGRQSGDEPSQADAQRTVGAYRYMAERARRQERE